MTSYEQQVEALSAYEHGVYQVDDWHDYHLTGSLEEVENPGDADIITSQIKGDDLHTVMLDIDVPAVLVPSTTEGHSHLYIDVVLTTRQLGKLLDALTEAGIVQPGYARVSKERGFTALRLPWVKKAQREPEDN